VYGGLLENYATVTLALSQRLDKPKATVGRLHGVDLAVGVSLVIYYLVPQQTVKYRRIL
jgi:hypothetical protein